MPVDTKKGFLYFIISSVAMGAVVVEKHITLDKNLEGPDHKASLEPDELKRLVASIRHIEAEIPTSTPYLSRIASIAFKLTLSYGAGYSVVHRLGFDNYRKLKEYSDRIGIEFLSTPFDVESVRKNQRMSFFQTAF